MARMNNKGKGNKEAWAFLFIGQGSPLYSPAITCIFQVIYVTALWTYLISSPFENFGLN